jgi:hypothetical protein
VGTLVSIFGVGMAYMSTNTPSFPPPFQDTAEEPTAWVYAVYGAYWSFGGWQVGPSVLAKIFDSVDH